MLTALLFSAALASEVVEGPRQAPVEVPVHTTVTALQRVRFERTTKSLRGMFTAAGLELGLGLYLVAKPDEVGSGAGRTLVLGGAVHVASAWYQLETNHRRAAAFASGLADVTGVPGGLEQLARRQAFLSHRDARTHAFSTGLYGGVASMGILGLAVTSGLVDPNDSLSRTVEGALGLAAVGLVGVGYHGSRWRASVRLATDWDGLIERSTWP